jgi:DNA repair exonuclease SbcCD ATPase subunit
VRSDRYTNDWPNSGDLLQENERLKQDLRSFREENEIELENLRIEYDEAVDLYDGALKRIKNLKEKNQALERKIEELTDEVADLEEERDVETRRAKEKTQKIRDMVRERNDLQEKLGEVAAKADKVHVSLNYEAKQSIAASTKLDKQLGDETFRKAMDQIYERFRECFLTVRRKQDFGQFGILLRNKRRTDASYHRYQNHDVRQSLDQMAFQASAQLEGQHFRRQTARLHLSRI